MICAKRKYWTLWCQQATKRYRAVRSVFTLSKIYNFILWRLLLQLGQEKLVSLWLRHSLVTGRGVSRQRHERIFSLYNGTRLAFVYCWAAVIRPWLVEDSNVIHSTWNIIILYIKTKCISISHRERKSLQKIHGARVFSQTRHKTLRRVWRSVDKSPTSCNY